MSWCITVLVCDTVFGNVHCVNYSTSSGKFVTGNRFSNTNFHWQGITAILCCFLPIMVIFSLQMRSFDRISTALPVQNLTPYSEFSTPISKRRDQSLSMHDTIFGNFCYDNVCTYVARTLILIPIANFSLEMDSLTPISCKMWKCRL